MYVGVDPGKSVGVATFTKEGGDINKTIMHETMFRDMFLQGLIDQVKSRPTRKVTFVVEAFWLNPDKAVAQSGSDMPASRAIGAVEMVDSILKDQSTIHFQPTAILKPTALKWARMNKYLSYSHIPDDVSAYSHGVYYLIKNGIRKHPVLEG